MLTATPSATTAKLQATSVLDLVNAVGKLPSYVPLLVDVVTDPALPEIAKRIRTIQALAAERKAKAKAKTSGLYGDETIGIGLKRFVKPLDAVIWYMKHTWAPWVIGGGTIIVLFGGGFALGRWSGKRAAKKAGLGAYRWRHTPRRRLQLG